MEDLGPHRSRRWQAKTASRTDAAYSKLETKDVSVCVVGAGVAALTAANRLLGHGFKVRLVGYCGRKQDGSSVKLGGRMYTEEWDLKGHKMKGPYKAGVTNPSEKSTIRFDAGTQFFTASESAFREEVSRWQQAGAVDVWQGARVGCLQKDGRMSLVASEKVPELFCGNGGMSKIIDLLTREIGEDKIIPHIAQRLLPGSSKRFVLEYEEIVTPSSYLDFVGGNLPPDRITRQSDVEFDYVVMAQGLAANQPRMVNFEDPKAREIIDCLKQNVRFQTIHTLSLAFDVQLPLPADVFVVEGCAEIGLVVHTTAKPGMSCAGGQDVWTIFCTPEFARDHALPKQKATVLQNMQEAFFNHLQLQKFRGRLVTNTGTPFGLLWPHGRCMTSAPAPTRALFHKEACVGVCGDYCAGAPCLEAAVLSAIAVADAVASHESGAALPPQILTDFQSDWDPVTVDIPWMIAHYPGLPPPPLSAPFCAMQPVAKYCCPTHDWLGCHPGLVFRNPAAYGLEKAGKDLSDFGLGKVRKDAALPANFQESKGFGKHGRSGKGYGKSKRFRAGKGDDSWMGG